MATPNFDPKRAGGASSRGSRTPSSRGATASRGPLAPDLDDVMDRVLGDVEFPTSKRTLLAEVGSQHLSVGDQSFDVRYLIQRLDRERFDHPGEVISAIEALPEVRGGR